MSDDPCMSRELRRFNIAKAASIVAAALVFLFLTIPAKAEVKTSFPRIGQMLIGGSKPYGEASAQAQMARFDLVIIDFGPGWTGERMRSAVRGIKARNTNIILLDYLVVNEVSRTAPGQQYLRDKLNANNWWVYPSGKTGSPVSSVWPGAAMTNYTNAVPVDGNGDRYNSWYAKEQHKRIWSQVPELDGTYDDNFFWHQRVGGDWDRNGKSDSGNIAAHREGMLTHLANIKTIFPDKYYTANIGDWRNTPSVPEYEQELHGGTLEGYLCRFEKDFNSTLREYHRRMREVANPKLVMINAEKCTSTPFGFERHKSMRYGLALTLMNDGYFDYNENYTQFPTQWFDEYAPEGRSTSWLGKAIDPPQHVAWQNGVYRRRFEHGMAIVNPRGNGTRAVQVEPGYRRIKGAQQPGVNDGREAREVRIADRDGLLLIRQGAGGPLPPVDPCNHVD